MRRSPRSWVPMAGVVGVLVGLVSPVSAQSPDPLVLVSGGGGQQTAGTAFNEQFREPLHAEDAVVDARYDLRSVPTFDVGGSIRLVGGLRAGVGYSQSSQSNAVAVTGTLPHPFRFNDPRVIAGEHRGAEREEAAVHIDVLWRAPLAGRLAVTLFGGPTWIRVRQDLVDALEFEENYPYDEAEFLGARTGQVSGTAVGFNAGADATWWLGATLGVGAQVRFVRATVDLAPAEGGSVGIEAGGVQVTGGVRLGF